MWHTYLHAIQRKQSKLRVQTVGPDNVKVRVRLVDREPLKATYACAELGLPTTERLLTLEFAFLFPDRDRGEAIGRRWAANQERWVGHAPFCERVFRRREHVKPPFNVIAFGRRRKRFFLLLLSKFELDAEATVVADVIDRTLLDFPVEQPTVLFSVQVDRVEARRDVELAPDAAPVSRAFDLEESHHGAPQQPPRDHLILLCRIHFPSWFGSPFSMLYAICFLKAPERTNQKSLISCAKSLFHFYNIY